MCDPSKSSFLGSAAIAHPRYTSHHYESAIFGHLTELLQVIYEERSYSLRPEIGFCDLVVLADEQLFVLQLDFLLGPGRQHGFGPLHGTPVFHEQVTEEDFAVFLAKPLRKRFRFRVIDADFPQGPIFRQWPEGVRQIRSLRDIHETVGKQDIAVDRPTRIT